MVLHVYKINYYEERLVRMIANALSLGFTIFQLFNQNQKKWKSQTVTKAAYGI